MELTESLSAFDFNVSDVSVSENNCHLCNDGKKKIPPMIVQHLKAGISAPK